MGNTFKRFLALALAVFMVIGMMPTNIAFATEDEATPCEHGIIGECADCLAGESKDEDIPEPGDGEETPEPGEGEETPEPGDGEETPKPGEGEETPEPGEGEETPEPGDGEETPEPGEGEETPEPGEGEETPEPGEGEETPEPGEGEETPEPGEGEETPNPDEGVDPAADDGEEQDGEVTPITGTITENMVWEDGAVIGGVTISGNVTITVQGTVTVVGTIRLAPDAIINVTFNGENGKLIRGGDFTGQMFYAEGVSGNFQNLTFNNITLDGGAVWTGDVDATLNRGTTNSGVKATGSVLYLVYANAVLNNSTLQNHDDSTGEKANAVFLRYYSTIEFNNSVVRNNNSISTYYRGGVITVRQGGTAKTNNSEVYGNSGAAGGFFGISSTGSYGGIAETYNSKFHNNYSDNGAVFMMQCNSKIGYLKIDGCEFYNNASKTAVLSEWAYSRPFIISNSSFHDNKCAVWDCHADPVLDLSGKIVVEEDTDYTKYLFETPLVLTGALAEGSSIPVSEASRSQLMKAGYVVSGSADYKLTDADLAKFKLPEGYSFVLVDVNADNVFDAVPVNTVVTPVTVILKDSLNEDTSAEQTVYEEIASRPVCEFVHEGLVFAGWIDTEGNTVGKQYFTETVTLTATWKIEVPKVTLGRKDQGANANTLVATVTNQYDSITYTYQWYKADEAIEGATSAEYTITESNTYKCVVTASFEGLESVAGSKSSSEDLKEIPKNYVAQVGADKFESLKAAVEAANAIAGGATVTLLQDVTLGEKLTISGNVTISGEKTITRDAAYTGTLFFINEGKALTLDGGLVIDGGNAWTYTKTPLEMDMANGDGTKVADHITPADGGVNATVAMIVNNGTLDANKVTIQNSYSTNAVSAISCGAESVTTLDGATLKNIAANQSGAVIKVLGEYAVLTIKGDTRITGNFGTGNGGIIQNYGQGTTVNLVGGSIDNNHVGVSGTVYASHSGNVNKINTFNMSGGIITNNVMEGYGPVYLHTNTVWNMTGGEISNNTSFLPSYVRSNYNCVVTISSGKIVNNEIAGVNFSGGYYATRPDIYMGTNSEITGGTYTQDVSEYLAPNYGLIHDEETGTYTVTDDIAEVNGTTYKSVAEAIAAANAGDTVKVLASHKPSATIVIDKKITLDLNGKTITTTATAAGEYMDAFTILADVTVTGAGKINARPSHGYTFYIGDKNGNAGNLTIENGTFYGETSVVNNRLGTVTINGGNYAVNLENETDTYDFVLNCIDANYKSGDAKIIVKGGVFYKFNPAANAAEGANTSFVAEDYVSEELKTDYFTVRKTNYVAEVNGVKYESLKAAVEAANALESATVTLLADVTLGEALAVTGNVTISGGKITRDAAYTGTLFEVASGATLTLDGGLVVDGNNNWSIDANNVVSPEAGKPVATGWMIINGGTLNVCNATLQNQYSEGTGGSTEGAIIARSNSVTNLEGATIQHFYTQDAGSAVRMGHSSGSCNGAVLNIGEGTNITGNIGDWNGSLIIVYGSNTINMTGGTIKNNVANSNGTLIMLYGIDSAMNMSGGLITENKGPVSAVYMHSSSKFVMTGGEISKNTGGTALYVRSNAGSVSISGDSKIVNNAADIWVSTSKTDDVNISGGSYTMDVSKWLAPGYGLIHDEETGIYTVTDHIYNLWFRDPVTNEQLSYIGPLQGNNAASLVETGKGFYANYYVMELEVLADARIDAPIIIDYPMTVNLNGHTLIADENVYPVIRVQGGADVTVTGNGSIVNATDYVFVLGASDGSSAGNLTIENGTFKGQTTIASVTKGQLTINGGSFECTESEYGAAYMLNCVDAGYNDGSAKITVKGGTFVGFNPENNAAEGAGTNFVAEGYIAETKDEGTTYTVRKTNYVAEVNGVKYESLTEALNACTNGETVKLIADITYDADDVVNAIGGPTGYGQYPNPSIVYIGGTKGATDAENQPSKVNAVLNLNGHTITNNADAYLFLFMDNCKITFTGEGTVQGTTDAPLIWSTGTETVVTIESGKYTGTYGSLMWATHSGDLVIKGGEFSTTAADASDLIMRNSKDRQNSKFFISGKSEVTVTGGTFKGFNPEKMLDDSKTPAFEFNAVAKGYKAVDNGDSTWSVVPNMIFEVHLTDANGEPHWLSPLRSNDINAALEKGKIWYDSLQGTYNFTLKILEDCELDESVVVNFPLTFDLNGKTIAFNADSGSAAVNVSSTMTLVDSSAEQTGKIVRNSNTDCSAIAVAGGNLTVKSGTIASSHKGIQAGGSGKTNTITITGGVIDATSAALNLNKGTNTVSITGGKLSAENAVHAASNNGDIIAEFTISGGEFVGNLRDIEVGELSITGGTFTVDPSAHVAKGYKAVDNGNGTWSVVPKVYVAQVGETKFETLSEAIEAAKAADTAVTVLKTIVLTEDGTLDLQGVRLNAGATLQNAPIFRVLANVTVTNGIVDGRGPTAGEGGINCYAFIVGNSETAGTLNIADGTYRGVTSAISITNGVVNISGGTFQAGHDNEGADYGTTYLLNCVDAAYKNGTAKYNITGGKFVGFNPENNAAEGEGTNFLSGNYKASDYYGDNKWYVAEANVQLDENKYFATIKDALGTLSSADTTVHTVKILADLEIDVNYSTYNYPILVNGFAIELDLNGKTITADWGKYTGSRVDNALIGVCNGGKLDVIDSVGGGKIVNNDTGSNAENRIFWIMTSTATKELVVNIKGGTFVQNDANTALLYVQGNKPSDSLAPMYITISGGHFESVNTDFFNAYDGFEHTSIITGGTFDKDPTDWEIKIADGYKVEENADGTWSVVPNMIFEVHLTDANGEPHWLSPLRSNDINDALEKGKIWYDSLQGTYNFTLKILEDCELDESVVVNFPLTIDLCGNTVTGEEVYPVIRVQGGANVTVKNGTITNDDYVFVLGASDGTSAGYLTVESGSYTGVTTVASVTKGELTITGGEFSVKESENGSTYLLNCIDANYADGSAKITVKGGTFKGFNPADNAAENPKANFVAEGYIAETKDEGATYTVVNAVKAGYVAKIEGTYYKTVQAAVDAAAEGAQIVMIADSKENMVMLMKGVTLDLNGNTLETGYFITLYGTQVLNTKTTGILKVPQTGLSLQLSNKYIPVWNEVDGYYLVDWAYATSTRKNGDNSITYAFIAAPKNGNSINQAVIELLKNGAVDNQLKIVIRFEWIEEGLGTKYQMLDYNQEMISTVYTQNSAMNPKAESFFVTVTGYESYDQVSVRAVVISDMGMEDVANAKNLK